MSQAVRVEAEQHGQALAPVAPRLQSFPEMVEPDLLLDVSDLASRLVEQVEAGLMLDAFLVAAGLNQVAEDFLHRDVFSLERAARLARRSGQTWPAGGLRYLRAGLTAARSVRSGERRLQNWQQRLATLVDELAAAVIGGRPAAHWAAESTGRLVEELDRLPAGLAGSVLRLPSCFRVLDQRPEDSVLLAERVLDQLGSKSRPVLVVGVRTSGSYLAPLLAASLRQLGVTTVGVATIRPKVPLLPRERRRLSAAAGAATPVLCDDPPASGAALERAADSLQALGFREPVLAIPLLEAAALPERLRRFRLALLSPDAWRITGLLEPDAVRCALQDLLPDHRVLHVDRISLDQAPDLKAEAGPRRHRRALYRAELLDGSLRRSSKLIYARGVGLGWFGRHSLAISGTLRDYLPEVMGIRDGVLYREWLPEGHRAVACDLEDGGALAGRVAGYVAARAAALPAAADRSLKLAGRQPVWQRIADLLGRGYGRARPLARSGLHRTAQALLSVERPSVVDASMALGQWFWVPDHATWVKVDYDERAFSNEDLTVYDPVYDLAVAAADGEMEGLEGFADRLRGEYEALTASKVKAERWTLYQLQHLIGLAGGCREHLAVQGPASQEAERLRDAAEAEAGRVMVDYLADRLLRDIAMRPDGPLCAIDIDGVLETSWLGFSCPTPLGGLVLRSLAAHGYRPILVSGRSLADVTARSRALGFAAGVAEYGAVAWAGGRQTPMELLDSGQRADLAMVRRALEALPGVRLDSGHSRVIRAYRLDSTGRRRGLQPAQVQAVLAEAAGRIRHVPGWAQSDFVPEGIDKGAGLRRLLRELGGEADGRPLAFAAGDTAEDEPMYSLARIGAPVTTPTYQAGLAAGVASLLGHRPGGCSVCRPHNLGADARLLIAALSAQDAHGAMKLTAALRLNRELLR